MAQTIGLVINISAAIFMGIGFLRGLKGLKYTLVSFAFFLLAIGLTLCFMEPISNFILSIKLVDGKGLQDLFLELISNIDFVKGMMEDSQRVTEVIRQLPRVIIQTLSFSFTLMIFGLICGLLHFFVRIFVLNKMEWYTKKPEKEIISKDDKVIVKVQKVAKTTFKSRIFGGVVGAIYGLVILVALMLPISGIIGTVNDVINTKYVEASETTDHKTLESTFGEGYQSTKEILSTYNDSILGTCSGIGNLDRNVVRKMTQVEIDGEKVNLIDDVKKMSVIYSDIQYVADFALNYKGVENLKGFNINKLKNVVNFTFDNEMFESLFDEVFDYSLDYLIKNTTNDVELNEYLVQLQVEINKKESAKNYVKDEVLNLLDVAGIVLDTDIMVDIDMLNKDEITTTQFLKSLSTKLLQKDEINSTNHKELNYIESIFTKLDNSTTLNLTACFGVNKFLGVLEESLIESLPDENLQKGFLGRVSLANAQMEFDEIGTAMTNALHLVKEFTNINTQSETLLYDLMSSKASDNTPLLTYSIKEVGQILNTLISLDVLNQKDANNTTILENLCKYLAKVEMLDFINVEVLTREGIINTEVNLFVETLNIYFNSTLYTETLSQDYNKENFVKDFVDLLNTVNTDGETNTKKMIKNVLSTELFQNTERLAFDFVSSGIQTIFGEDVPTLNTQNIFTDTEKEKVSNLVSQIVEYYGLTYEKDQSLINNLLGENSNFVILGTILENMRSVELFADQNGKSGVYTIVMLKLNEDFGEYIDFEVATKSTFNWITEMETYSPYIKQLLDKEVLDEEKTVTILEVILGETNLTLDEALEQINTTELLVIYKGVEDCELIAPLKKMLMNYVVDLIKEEALESVDLTPEQKQVLENITVEDIEEITGIDLENIESVEDLINYFLNKLN